MRFEHLTRLLRASTEPLYLLADAAQGSDVLRVIQAVDTEYESLYTGPEAEELADLAPYLVLVPRDSGLLESFVEEGWGRSWGIFLNAPAEFRDVRRHFRRFLLVRDESDRELYFRFYDPRVLRTFLPTCNTSEMEEFFGPIDCFHLEGRDPEVLLTFRHGPSGLQQEATPLIQVPGLSS